MNILITEPSDYSPKALEIYKLLGRVYFYTDLSAKDKKTFLPYILKYNPALIFSADVFNDNDVYLLATAKAQNIKTVGMIRSWDNFNTKGVFRVKPDKLIVHNEILKNQAIKWNGLSESDIFISGVPQYDRYINNKRMDREVFLKK